jgi:hypothetical protein
VRDFNCANQFRCMAFAQLTYLIVDLDTKYCTEFRHALAREGMHVIRLPPCSPLGARP